MLSNPTTITPYGTSTPTYTQDPNGYYQSTVNQTLTPQSQQIFDAQQNTRQGLADLSNQGLGIAQNTLGSQFQYNGPGIQTGVDTSGVAKMPVNAGTTGQQAIMSRLQPQMDRQTASTQTQLANQGLRPGSEAYDNAMKDLGYQQNDATQQAVLNGLNLDMGANNQGYNQALQSGQFANTAQNQNLSQQLQLRDLPLNEISALMSGSQVVNPQFQGYSGTTVQPANYQAANAQSQQNALTQYNAGVASNNNTTSAGAAIAAAALTAM